MPFMSSFDGIRLAGLALALALGFSAGPANAGGLAIHGKAGNVHIGITAGDFSARKHGFGRHGHSHLRFGNRGRHFGHRGGHPRRHGGRPPVLFDSGPVNDFAAKQKRRPDPAPRIGHPRRRTHGLWRDWYWLDGYPYPLGADGRLSESEAYVLPPPAPPGEGAGVASEPVPAARPEPELQGPQFQSARGHARTARRWTVGDQVAGVPQVALDWRDYDLPRPPRGQAYVRVEGTVLRIDSDSRRIREVVAR